MIRVLGLLELAHLQGIELTGVFYKKGMKIHTFFTANIRILYHILHKSTIRRRLQASSRDVLAISGNVTILVKFAVNDLNSREITWFLKGNFVEI